MVRWMLVCLEFRSKSTAISFHLIAQTSLPPVEQRSICGVTIDPILSLMIPQNFFLKTRKVVSSIPVFRFNFSTQKNVVDWSHRGAFFIVALCCEHWHSGSSITLISVTLRKWVCVLLCFLYMNINERNAMKTISKCVHILCAEWASEHCSDSFLTKVYKWLWRIRNPPFSEWV